ncbi:MAG TPA: amidase [Chloroflexota bacterium]|jgi:aspartyl-tRNA(Asn)/glutamyl-tRNA(Gln) amidotransferase subunit A
MPDLPTTIADAAAALRARELSALELTEALLARARAAQPALGAFIAFMDGPAGAAARQADADFARGADRGPLQGIPLGIKDIIATSDAPTTANSRVLDRAWGERPDATSVRKLREAGAVPLGKLTLHEFATGWPDPATGFQPARNPWNLGHSPGGSSSGTGAAVAADLIPAGLGTDTSGSIRGPAAYSGISGLKPTFGRVSKEGCVPLGYSLDNIGPMAHTARDCALLLQTLAGYDPADPCTVDRPVPDYAAALTGSLEGVRIGLPRAYFLDAPGLEAEVRDAVLAAAEAMGKAGARIVAASIPHAEIGSLACTITIRSESYAYHERDLRERADLYGRHTRRVLQLGALFTAADFVQAQRVRALVRAEVAAALSTADVLLVPTMANLAASFRGYDPDRRLTATGYTGLWNMTGNPALSVPGGFSASGLPIGLQIVGRPFDEATVLAVGDAYQRLTDWHARRPPALPARPPSDEDVRGYAEETSEPDAGALAAVGAILAQGRMQVSEEDRLRLGRVYPALRELADRIREVELGPREPALIFPAAVRR